MRRQVLPGYGLERRKEKSDPVWIIRLTSLVVFIVFIQITASAYSQAVSISAKNVRMSKIFEEIHNQTGYNFLYNTVWLKSIPNVTLDVENASVELVLEKCLKDLPFSYSIIENTIVIKQVENSVNSPKAENEQARIEIIGKVTTWDGSPIPNVYISIKGTVRGAATDANGNYVLNIENNDSILIFSAVGMKRQEIPISNRTVIDVVMEEDVISISEMVVVSTGYQRISRERSTGSYVQLNGGLIKDKSVSTNVIDQLEGLAPGLAVNYGAGNDKYLLRGLSTINANKSLLVVVDGMPMSDINSLATLINPNDVESVTFLKDATATSIWGALAANGVIVISTKRGRVSKTPQKIKVNYNAFMSFKGQPDLDYLKLMSTPDFLNAAKEVFSPTINTWNVVSTSSGSNPQPVVPPHEQILYDLSRGIISQSIADARFDSLSVLNNRSQINESLFQPAVLQNHNINFNGGSEVHNYYGSLSFVGDENHNRSNTDRYQLNLRQDFAFSKAVKLDLTTNFAFEKSESYLLTDLPGTAGTLLPYAMFKDANENPLSMAYLLRHEPYRITSQNQSRINLDYFPLLEPENTKNGNTYFTGRVNAGLSVKLFKPLTYEGRAQYQRGVADGYEYYDQNSYKVRNERVFYTQLPATPGGLPTYFLPVSGGHYSTKNITQVAWSVRNQLVYDNTLDNKHQITALAGTELRSNLTKSMETYRRGYDFQTQTYSLYDELALANTGVSNPVNITSSQTVNRLTSRPQTNMEAEVRFFSLYGNVAYSFDRRYTFNGSIRMDQSNLFGTDKSAQYKPIWSIGGAWNLSKEPFFNAEKISNLNLRATYGLAGNAPNPGQGGPFDVLGARSSTLYSDLGLGYIIFVPKNQKLSWERTSTTNLGVDFGLFEYKVSGSIDLYKKNTTDLLGYIPVDPTTGFVYAYDNLGNMENKGIEIQLNTVNISAGSFSWKSILTLSYNENRITSLKNMTPLTYSSKMSGSPIEGYSSNPLFGYNYIGLDNTGKPMALSSKGDTLRLSSQVKIDDPLYAGTTQPLWYGGLTNILEYKSFSLSFLIVYNLGHQMRKDVNQFYTGRLLNNIPGYFKDRWRVPGDEANTDIPAYIASSSLAAQRMTSLYTSSLGNIVSASYAKLRDVTLTYSLPEKMTKNIFIDNFQVYGQVNNIMLWKNNNNDIDPEYYNLSSGTRLNKMPAFYTLGIRVSFK